MINVSKLAQKHFDKLLSKQKPNTNIRVFITNIGTTEAECGIAYCSKNDVSDNDNIIKYNSFHIYVNENEMLYLQETMIDIKNNDLGVQLTINAPFLKLPLNKNYKSLNDRVTYFLDSEINPKLLLHKGKVTLVEITKEGFALVKFSGGCNGCSMIEGTLKKLVENKIIAFFTEIKGVHDITKHQIGKHSYDFFN
ncbi:NifU family protein [Buchnera aphidicola (Mollitrichosiphum nigrofasciatum)]|uniref:NifU family protein n=1 Tax=Buchnera aphidicola TaxID=9 RepID=UPI0031B8AD6F